MILNPEIKAKLDEYAETLLHCLDKVDPSDTAMRHLITVEALRQAADWGWKLCVWEKANRHGQDVSGNRMGGE